MFTSNVTQLSRTGGMEYLQQTTVWISGKGTPRFRCDAAVDTPTVKIVSQKIPAKNISPKTSPEKWVSFLWVT